MLSKIIIFVMKDNYSNTVSKPWFVVNCFQKLLSSWWRTTQQFQKHTNYLLWIAFKNYYLRDEGQLIFGSANNYVSCELLSKIIIFVMKDNGTVDKEYRATVVNCFQKLLSSWWRTTHLRYRCPIFVLWIAFKNYYLRDEGQRK